MSESCRITSLYAREICRYLYTQNTCKKTHIITHQKHWKVKNKNKQKITKNDNKKSKNKVKF